MTLNCISWKKRWQKLWCSTYIIHLTLWFSQFLVDFLCFYWYLGNVQILNLHTFTPNMFKIKGVNGECVWWSRTPVNKGGSWFFYLVQLPLIFFLPITKYNTGFASTEMILGSRWTWWVTLEWHKASLAMHRQALNPFRKLHLFFQQKGLDFPTGRVHPSLPTGSHASGAN